MGYIIFLVVVMVAGMAGMGWFFQMVDKEKH